MHETAKSAALKGRVAQRTSIVIWSCEEGSVAHRTLGITN